MVVFEIIGNDETLYKLKQKNKFSTIELIFEFFGIEKPENGTYLAISEKLLDRKYEGFSQPYSFEPYMEYVDKEMAPVESEEFIVLHNNNKNIIMKRIYG